jgi:hypothetical protein
MEIACFLFLKEKEIPANVWWQIENYGENIGPNTLPFALDYASHIYYIKWVNEVPQVWYAYRDMEGTETEFVKESFDALLEDLYAG